MIEFSRHLPMTKIEILSQEFSFLKLFEHDLLFENAYIVEVSCSSKIRDIATQLQEFFVKNIKAQAIIIYPIKNLKNKGDTKEDLLEDLKKITNIFNKKNFKINIVRAGEIIEDRQSFINKCIREAKDTGQYEYRGGRYFHYLISKSDLKQALIKILEANIKNEIIDVTLNSILEEDLVSKIKTKYNLKFIEKSNSESNEKIIDIKSQHKIGFKPLYTIKEYIEQSYEPILPIVNAKIQLQPKSNTNKKISKFAVLASISKNIVITFSILLILFTADIALNNYFLYKNIKASNFENAIFYAERLRNIRLPTKWGANYLNIYNSTFYALNLLEVANTAWTKENIEIHTIDTLKELSNKSLIFAKEINYDYLITQKEKDLYDQYDFILNSNLVKYIDLLEILPYFEKPRKILVLIQNSNELRPSGGFIGSYAIINIQDKSIKEYKFDDIYNIDGTLESKHPNTLLKMPAKYQAFIKNEYLYARDLNLILDYKLRNETAFNYFETALNTNFDAIAYVNLDSLKRVLDITGPIKIAMYDEMFTKDNFDILAQTYSEKNYYEGSTQKKNILSILGAKAIEKIQYNVKPSKEIITNISQALEQKEILLYTKDKQINLILDKLNLTNEITPSEKGFDYFYIIENNLGENKVNKKTERKIEYNLEYDQRRGLKLVNIDIDIQNKSDTYAWPYGNYKGLTQIFIPKNINISKITFNNNNTGTVNITQSVTIEEINNLTLIELPFSIKPNEKINIGIEYEQSSPDFTKSEYGLMVIKQPGNKEYGFEFNINIPDKKQTTQTYKINKDTKIIY